MVGLSTHRRSAEERERAAARVVDLWNHDETITTPALVERLGETFQFIHDALERAAEAGKITRPRPIRPTRRKVRR